MSPIMHNAAIRDLNLNYIYLAFNIHPTKLNLAVNGFKVFNIKGINVTIPFKEKIMEFLDEIDPIALRIGAVNAIKNDDGYLTGRNTDAEGGIKALLNAGYSISGKRVLILGAGGAARALTYAIANDVSKIVIANRTKEKGLKIAHDIRMHYGLNIQGKDFNRKVLREESKKADILINTTPIGMYPDTNKSPIAKELLHEELLVYDIVYNPLETKLMKDAAEIGCKILGGLDMLVNQGVLAFEWWTNKKPNASLMKHKIIEVLGVK
jgi:shikimate dehydrogenase